MKKYLLAVISLLAGLILFYWIIKLIGWQAIQDAFHLFTGWDGVAILSVTLVIMALGIWRWNEILLAQDVQIRFRDLINPFFAGFSVMFLAPTLIGLGEGFRAYIIKNKNDVPWPKAATSVFLDRILDWTVSLIIIAIGIPFFVLKIGLPPKEISLILGLGFLVLASIIIFFYSRAFRGKSFAEFFLKVSGLHKLNMGAAILNAEEEVFSFFRST